MLAIPVLSMFALAFNIQPVEGSTGTVYIRADGRIEPSYAPISSVDNITYVFADSIFGSIVVERDDILIDGAGYTLQGTGREWWGIDLAERTNVKVQNTQIKNFTLGIGLRDSSNISIVGNSITANRDFDIHLDGSSSNRIIGNNITNNNYGIDLSYGSSSNGIIGNAITNCYEAIYGIYSHHNNVSGNIITDNEYGIVFSESSDNVIIGNNVTDNGGGIMLNYSPSNTISTNNIAANTQGIGLSYSSNNNVIGSNIVNNDEGIWLLRSYGNRFYHNYFIYNIRQAGVEVSGYDNVWDNGFPSGGNYWSDYAGTDENKDGFGDKPYVIDAQNADHYPLMVSSPIIDIEPPILSTTYPYSGEVIRSSEVTVSWEGADYVSGINHYVITIDDGNSINVGLNTSYTFAELDDGQHVVRIAAFDNAGNFANRPLYFTINAGAGLLWPPYIATAVAIIVMVITLGTALYILKRRYSSGVRKPDRRLIR